MIQDAVGGLMIIGLLMVALALIGMTGRFDRLLQIGMFTLIGAILAAAPLLMIYPLIF